MIDEKGTTLLHRIHGDGGITGKPADATKGFGFVGVGVGAGVGVGVEGIAFDVGFGSYQFTVGSKTPKISAMGVKKNAREGAKGSDELTGIAALKSSPGKLQEKLLESLVRMRRNRGPRISGVGCQCSPALR